MIRIWIALIAVVVVIRLIRSHMKLAKKILIGMLLVLFSSAGYLVYSQLFSIDADPGAVIAVLRQTDKAIMEYHERTGHYPDNIADVYPDSALRPQLPKGYRLADGFNMTSADLVFVKTAERNCDSNHAAVMINFQPYDAGHIESMTK